MEVQSSLGVFMLAYIILALAVASRFPQHAWHFTAVGASLLFFGAKQPRSRMWIPVAAFAVTDIILTRFVNHFPVSWETFASSLYYALAVVIGSYLLRSDDGEERYNALKIGGVSLLGSATFFVLSNFAVWAAWNMYEHTFSGLARCYVAAIPFFRNTVVSDLVFSLAFFAIPVLVTAGNRQRSAVRVRD